MSAPTFPARPALDLPAAATVPAYEWAAACRRDMVAARVAGMDDAQRSAAWAACMILNAALDAYASARIRDGERALVAQAVLTPDFDMSDKAADFIADVMLNDARLRGYLPKSATP